jgi:hypothetical protein
MAGRQAKRGFGDTETSTFAKMGDEELTSHLVNVSGQRSPYTMPVAKKSTTTDQGPVGGTAHRSAKLIKNANGPACTPVATISYENAPEKNLVGRGLRTVPSKAGLGDFKGAGDSEGKVIN